MFARACLQVVRLRVHLVNKIWQRRCSGMVSKYIHLDGVNIHYEKNGSGDHVLLLLPGGLGSGKTDFAPQLDQMNKDIFTLIAWDPPGYGRSRPPNRKWSDHFLKSDADLAASLMQKIGYLKYSVLGWSDGGTTGMILASRHPESVQKLVSWGASSYITKPEVDYMEKTIKFPDMWSARMRQPFLDMYGEEYLKQLCVDWTDCFSKYYHERDGNICDDQLSNIKCPTLIVHGDKDPLVPAFHCQHLNTHIRNSRLHRMPEGKHNIHLRYPNEFNKLVEGFLLEPIQSRE